MGGSGDGDGDVEVKVDTAAVVRSRRLFGAEEWAWYVFAAVTYIAAGIWQKWLLNWLVGPLWLVAVVCLGPALVDRVRLRR